MPYAQGELDGLCGVYAIVNAVENTVAGWKKEDANGLFNHLVTRLSGQGRLHTAMADGIGVRELCRLIDHAGAYLADEYGLSLKRHIAFARRVPLSSYWKRLQEPCNAGATPPSSGCGANTNIGHVCTACPDIPCIYWIQGGNRFGGFIVRIALQAEYRGGDVMNWR